MAFDARLLNGAGVLAAIVETGSFVRASEALGVTASAISRTSFAIGEALLPFARIRGSHRVAWRPGAARRRS
ncbi:LysR family transcriptional regulator [Burkholderia gladioli]|uniref:LysR family transcriptional regulator n=1 Tax=Burkholderia gladioli TaxID=28095 RepID=UPI001ABA6278|nr:LysR family transcriptional regulator [Burkholderia gladioli]URV28944.1 LysR family transcriptional regulator [Burkholderia gladioli]